jgi:predicted alpha/beta hydrolase
LEYSIFTQSAIRSSQSEIHPIALSAWALRNDLAVAERIYHPKHGIVLIGHSMGGIVSGYQSSESIAELLRILRLHIGLARKNHAKANATNSFGDEWLGFVNNAGLFGLS